MNQFSQRDVEELGMVKNSSRARGQASSHFSLLNPPAADTQSEIQHLDWVETDTSREKNDRKDRKDKFLKPTLLSSRRNNLLSNERMFLNSDLSLAKDLIIVQYESTQE